MEYLTNSLEMTLSTIPDWQKWLPQSLISAVIVAVIGKRHTWRIIRVLTVWPLLIIAFVIFFTTLIVLAIPLAALILLAGKKHWLENIGASKKGGQRS